MENRELKNQPFGYTVIEDLGRANIFYRGGSMFVIVFDRDSQALNSVPFEVSKLKEMIEKGQIVVSNQPLLDSILSRIDPKTGETETEYKDGKPKQKTQQVYEYLKKRDKAHEQEEDEDTLDTPTPEQKRTPSKPVAVSSAHKTFNSDPVVLPRKKVIPTSKPTSKPTNESASDTSTSAQPTTDTEPNTPETASPTTEQDELFDMPEPTQEELDVSSFIHNDDDKEGEASKQKSSDKDEQNKRSSMLKVFMGVTVILWTILFVIGLSIGRAFIGDTHITAQKEQPTQQQQPSSKEQGESDTSISPSQVPYTPSDAYDSLQDVSMLAIASDEEYNIARGLLGYVQKLYDEKDRGKLAQVVDLDRIADQIAQSYISLNKASLIPSTHQDKERAYIDEYKRMTTESELACVKRGDSYNSIFGGELRDVRVGDYGKTLYATTKARSGKHQRVTFVIKAVGDNSWAITEIVNPDKYASLISTGAFGLSQPGMNSQEQNPSDNSEKELNSRN